MKRQPMPLWRATRVNRWFFVPLIPLMLLLPAACGGPRMKLLTDASLHTLDPRDRVEVYVGKLDPPYEPVAIIDSEAYPTVTDEIKQQQIEQLRAKARRLGANTLHEIRILPKEIKNFTTDEKVPFSSWQQGSYQIYFMRATAVRRPETEPASLAEARPLDGWIVDRYAPPPRLETLPGPIPMPSLHSRPTTATTTLAPGGAANVP
jgi:hypothetical protein